jgi:hypothetical protein
LKERKISVENRQIGGRKEYFHVVVCELESGNDCRLRTQRVHFRRVCNDGDEGKFLSGSSGENPIRIEVNIQRKKN